MHNWQNIPTLMVFTQALKPRSQDLLSSIGPMLHLLHYSFFASLTNFFLV